MGVDLLALRDRANERLSSINADEPRWHGGLWVAAADLIELLDMLEQARTFDCDRFTNGYCIEGKDCGCRSTAV